METLVIRCFLWRLIWFAVFAFVPQKGRYAYMLRGRSNRSEYTFKIGENVLETTDRYKYLGVIFHEKQDYSINSEAYEKQRVELLAA